MTLAHGTDRLESARLVLCRIVQGLIFHHFALVDGRLERHSIPLRYVWPSELDLMAQLAGMSLRERWAGWKREPFASPRSKHVSVWEKPPLP